MSDRTTGMGGLVAADAAFRTLADRYDEIKRSCEANVASWRWASDDFYDPRPLYFERHGYKKGRLLNQAPKKQADKPEYGLGADGTVHVARKHVRFDGYPERLWFYETFYSRSESEIEVAHFRHDPGKPPIYFAIGAYSGSHLHWWHKRAADGVSQESYSWHGDQVVRIDFDHAPVDTTGNYGPLVPWNRYEISYGSDGAIEEILCHWPRRPDHPRESTETIYRRPAAGVAIDDLLEKLRTTLMTAVIERMRRARIAEPAYSLVLAWDPGQRDSLPPSLGVGLDRERSKWLREKGARAKWFLWNPAEYENFLEMHSENLDQACRPVNQECRLRDSWKPAAVVLNHVARELGRMDWSGILPTTDDFVAYAVDLQLTEFRRNLKASATPELIKVFEKNDWLLP